MRKIPLKVSPILYILQLLVQVKSFRQQLVFENPSTGDLSNKFTG
jgi:hypothetical protein